MPTKTLQTELASPSVNFEAIAGRVATKTDLLPELFAGLSADKARIKYGCLKVLRLISEQQPAVLYPEFDRLVDLLDSELTILKWGAIIIMGNLARVDAKGKIDGILDRYLEPISGPVMITAANTIGGAGKIARAKPHLADKVVAALLKVETATYQTAECRNVALGHTVAALDLFFEHIRNAQPVLAFVERQLRNSRNAVRRKAVAFLKQHNPSPQPGRHTKRSSAKAFMKTNRTSSAAGAGDRNSLDTKAVRSTQTDLPRDLADALHAAKLADFFAACTAAHRREYLKWIDEAKRPETRRARIAKAMTMLADKRAVEDARVKRTA